MEIYQYIITIERNFKENNIGELLTVECESFGQLTWFRSCWRCRGHPILGRARRKLSWDRLVWRGCSLLKPWCYRVHCRPSWSLACWLFCQRWTPMYCCLQWSWWRSQCWLGTWWWRTCPRSVPFARSFLNTWVYGREPKSLVFWRWWWSKPCAFWWRGCPSSLIVMRSLVETI